jgi:hypothetical protein
MLSGHDTKEHINFGKYFAEQFWEGDLYPRWLLNMNHGLGSPSLFVYPPLPAYVYALLLPVAKILHLDAFCLGEYLCLLTSGLSAFFWMTTLAGRRVSLVVATLYMLMPYHLAVDFYRRGALAESWALAWIPLVLYFTTQAVRKKRYAIAGLALAYALLIVSHLISVLLFSALPLLLALTIAERGRKARALWTVIGGLALGTAVSAAYLVPAFANAKYFPVSRVGGVVYPPENQLLVYGKKMFTGDPQTGFVQSVALVTADTVLFIAFCGIMALKNGPRERKKLALFWLAVCPIPFFLVSMPSLAVWKALPWLTTAVQYPWRFDVILCVAALPLAAFLLSDVFRAKRPKWGLLFVVLFFAATWVAGYAAAVKRYALPSGDRALTANEDDGWLEAWAPAGMDQYSALRASTGPRARFLTGQGAAAVLLWKPRHIEVQTDCMACGPLMVNQFYYPKWKAQLLPQGTPLPVAPALPEGLVEVQAPPGRQKILLEIPYGLDERTGDWLSALGTLVCAVLLGMGFARSRHRPAAAPIVSPG